MDTGSKRIDNAYAQIALVQNKLLRRDLLMILRSTEAAYSKMDKESVECRRLKKQTLKYQELVDTFEELITHLEKHITFANLLG